MSEFLIVSSTFAREPLLALLVVFGLLIAFGALLLRLNEIGFGKPIGSSAPVEASYVPLFAHLGLDWRRASICRHRSSPGSRAWHDCWARGSANGFCCRFEGEGRPVRPIALGHASSLTKKRGGRALWVSPPVRPR